MTYTPRIDLRLLDVRSRLRSRAISVRDCLCRRGVWSRSAGSVVLSCLLATGCGSDRSHQVSTSRPSGSLSGSPTTIVRTTPEASTRPMPTMSPSRAQSARPAEPAGLQRDTIAGAVATAKYWLQTLSYAFASGDTKPMWSISRSTCGVCGNYGKPIDAIGKDGGSITGIIPFKPRSAKIVSFSKSEATVLIKYMTGQNRIRTSSHAKSIIGAPPAADHGIVQMTWTSQRWIVNELL